MTWGRMLVPPFTMFARRSPYRCHAALNRPPIVPLCPLIGMVQVTGSNLTDGYVKVGTTNDINAASDLEADEEDASNASKTFISPIQNGSTLYFWKNGALWFTCAVVAPGGGGDNGDE